MTLDPVFNWIAALALVQLFASAAWHKLSDFDSFKRILANYQIISHSGLPILAKGVIVLELLAVALLAIPDFRVIGSIIAIALLSSYAIAMSSTLIKGRRLADCGCHFGKQSQPVSWFLVVRNTLLIALGVFLIIPITARPMNFLDFGSILFAFALCPLIYSIAHGLHHNHNTLQKG